VLSSARHALRRGTAVTYHATARECNILNILLQPSHQSAHPYMMLSYNRCVKRLSAAGVPTAQPGLQRDYPERSPPVNPWHPLVGRVRIKRPACPASPPRATDEQYVWVPTPSRKQQLHSRQRIAGSLVLAETPRAT